ncbi:NO signaling/Golgi transport ligand-binding domain-containing protein [Dioszegia hungarica]|uniref:Trafficking protein particle complex subunit n=1 Tax=Dioszegia hungarica TaxID=4972 RepID=A0AA38HDC5_9TREE|nr:NO signaling/Golgi transport ligand-binding domain-containing protein [Dioszegia hungarica]KAI9638391.1 NO signaling/Golgi transport ligand-binding domain-containing protein [Dioszegia hungarica]
MDGSYYPSNPLPQSSTSTNRFSLTAPSSSPSTSTSTSKPTTTAGRIASATGLYTSSSPALAPAPTGILDRPLNKGKGAEVGMSAFAFLLAEVVSYSQSRVDSVTDLERRLSSLGYEAGLRILSLILLRNTQQAGGKDPKREHRLIPILQFVHTQVYKYCFGKPADGLERSVEGEDEYMLTMNQPPLTQHISIPKDMSQLSCEAFTAGIVEGVLDGLDVPARVTAHTVGTDQYPQRTVILIKLDQKVMDREEVLGK